MGDEPADPGEVTLLDHFQRLAIAMCCGERQAEILGAHCSWSAGTADAGQHVSGKSHRIHGELRVCGCCALDQLGDIDRPGGCFHDVR